MNSAGTLVDCRQHPTYRPKGEVKRQGVGMFDIQVIHNGAHTLFRFSLHLEGGRTYYGPGLYSTREQAESAATLAARTRRVMQP